MLLDRLPKEKKDPTPLSGLLAIANLGAALGLGAERAPMLCISLSIYLMFVAVIYFTALLVPQGAEKPEA